MGQLPPAENIGPPNKSNTKAGATNLTPGNGTGIAAPLPNPLGYGPLPAGYPGFQPAGYYPGYYPQAYPGYAPRGNMMYPPMTPPGGMGYQVGYRGLNNAFTGNQ
jgi:hypothetical protein